MELKFSLPLEFKASDIGGDGQFAGHAAVFGNVDLTGDMIEPGAFAATLEQHRARGSVPAMLWSHDPALPIGRLTELHEDAKGLFARAALTLATRTGAEAYALLKDGAVGGMSIGFNIPKGGAEYVGDVRKLKRIDLLEVSVVAVPANPEARITAVKSALQCVDRRELEGLLRERLSLSRRKAAHAANLLWPALNGRDDQEDVREEREAGEQLAQFAAQLGDLNSLLTKGN